MTEKEKGASPYQTAPQTDDDSDSTPHDQAASWPRTWSNEKPSRFRGKGKRNARRAAAERKRGVRGAVDAGLAGLILLALVAGLLLAGVVR